MEEERNLFDILKSFGFSIEQILNTDSDNVLGNEFTELPKESKEAIHDSLYSFADIVSDIGEKKKYIDQTKQLLNGAYKVLIKKGTHLANSKATEGAYRGALLSNVTNQVAGQAELVPIDYKSYILNQNVLVSNIFNIASVVTRQYYLSEINNHLKTINDKVNYLINYFENKDKSELLGYEDSLNDVIRNINYYLSNNDQKKAHYSRLLKIEDDLRAKIKQFELQIADIMQSIDEKSKTETIVDNIKKINDYYDKYWCAVYLFSKCKLCAIGLDNNYSAEYLTDIKNQIHDYMNKYNNNISRDFAELKKIVKTSKAFNLQKLPQIRPSTYISRNSSSLFISSLSMIVNAGALIENTISEKKDQQKKEEIQNLSKMKNKFEDDTKLISSQINIIDNLIDNLSRDIEIWEIDNNTYYRFLDEPENNS